VKIKAFFLLFAMLPAVALAMDHGQYGDTDPSIREWIEGLRNGRNTGCCATSDGTKVDAADWRRTEMGYEVMIQGTWLTVDPAAVVTDRNRVGYAIVWTYFADNKINIRCFLPGTET
jgi:hypothetical protein